MSLSRVKVADPLSTPPSTPSPSKKLPTPPPQQMLPSPPIINVTIITPVTTTTISSLLTNNCFHYLLEGAEAVLGIDTVGQTTPATDDNLSLFSTVEIYGSGGSVVHVTSACREVTVRYEDKFISVCISDATTAGEVVRCLERSLKIKNCVLHGSKGSVRTPLRRNSALWNLIGDFVLKKTRNKDKIKESKDLLTDINVSTTDNNDPCGNWPIEKGDVLCVAEFQDTQPFECIADCSWSGNQLLEFLLCCVDVDVKHVDEYILVVKKGKHELPFTGTVGKWARGGCVVVEVNKKTGCHVVVIGDVDEKPIKCQRVVEFYREAPTEDDTWMYANRMSFTVVASSSTLVSDVAKKFQAIDAAHFLIMSDGKTTIADSTTTVGDATKILFVKATNPLSTSFAKALELLDSFEPVLYSDGNLLITKYRTILVRKTPIGIPHASVAVIQLYTIDDRRDVLFLFSKDFKCSVITGENFKIRTLLKYYFSDELRLLFPRKMSETYAFRTSGTTTTESEWRALSFDKEFSRLGLVPSNGFQIIDNTHGQVSPTYPPIVATADGIDITSILSFRSKGRIPAVSWRGFSNQTLSRSAQPLPGALGRARCEADESLLQQFVNITKSVTKKLFIFDARPPLNAQANRLQGGGIESSTYYPFCEFQYLSIENIHEVRNAYYKMVRAILTISHHSYDYRNAIESSKWYQFIHTIMVGAVAIVNKLRDGNSVLVHCSDGWDRTSQLTSLAMIILDPYYRTIEGLLVLIEKEWITFGHKFSQRSGLGVKYDIDLLPLTQMLFREVRPRELPKYEIGDSETSPIYGQWIECVEILRKQHPDAFEYNGELLIFLLDSLYECQFANYLEYPNVCSSNISNLSSMVPYVYNHRTSFTNSQFKAVANEISVSLNPLQYKLWKEYYTRFKQPNILNL
ncbi:Myotubularin phosphatase domain-containing protein [Entamoeba marina]